MRYKLDITEDAHNDIQNVSEWYEEQQKGLGKRFMISVKDCINLIVKNPFAFAEFFSQIRKANTKKFPYSLYYIIEENVAIIFAVIHLSRNDKVWKERI
jgi:plasmid stabilization system protein ParE